MKKILILFIATFLYAELPKDLILASEKEKKFLPFKEHDNKKIYKKDNTFYFIKDQAILAESKEYLSTKSIKEEINNIKDCKFIKGGVQYPKEKLKFIKKEKDFDSILKDLENRPLIGEEIINIYYSCENKKKIVTFIGSRYITKNKSNCKSCDLIKNPNNTFKKKIKILKVITWKKIIK
jgi:type III secretory pathway component EscV